MDCNCGRVHFTSASGHGDYEQGELEQLQAKAAQSPEKYIEHTQYDYVEAILICGERVILGCQCRQDELIAALIETHANALVEYLKRYYAVMAEMLKRATENTKANLETLATAQTHTRLI